jgi:trypsin-like peptidase
VNCTPSTGTNAAPRGLVKLFFASLVCSTASDLSRRILVSTYAVDRLKSVLQSHIMPKIWVPAGRIPTKAREFERVAADVRHAVFSVNRFRPNAAGGYDVTPLGSGFFVSSEVFATCWHVIDPPSAPHQAGDVYNLVNNLDGTHGIVHQITGGVGVDIHLYPDTDFAILISHSKADQAYLPISYADVPVGREIGVAGYPLAQLSTDANGNLTLGHRTSSVMYGTQLCEVCAGMGMTVVVRCA